MIRPFRLAALLSLAPALLAAADAPPLTLEDCVTRALQQNFSLAIQQFSTDSAAAAVTIADADYDPALQLKVTAGGNKSPNTDAYVDSNGNIITTSSASKTRSATLNVSQKIITGATITATGALDRSKTSPSRSTFNPAYDSDVGISVNQPLLRGFGSSYNRATIERARLGLDRANYDFKGAVLDLVRDVERAYYNLAYAREQLGVRQFSLNVAQQLFDENKAKLNVGSATDLDVLQGEVGVANARRNILTAQQMFATPRMLSTSSSVSSPSTTPSAPSRCPPPPRPTSPSPPPTNSPAITVPTTPPPKPPSSNTSSTPASPRATPFPT